MQTDAPFLFGAGRGLLWSALRASLPDGVRLLDLTVDRLVPAGDGSGRMKGAFLTVVYLTASGQTNQLGVFAKRSTEEEHIEILHYEYLTRERAPIPLLYGTADCAGEERVLLIEQLQPLACTEAELASDRDLLRQFLGVTARFNAVRPCDEHLRHLPRQDWGANLSTSAALLRRIIRLAKEGDTLGADCARFCRQNEPGILRLAELAVLLAEAVRQMEVGLCHQDHHAGNVGLRPRTGEMLVIDLELIQLMPRFWDAAQWLGGCREDGPLCESQSEMSQWYLECYQRHGGRGEPLGEFLGVLRSLWLTRQLCDVWWRLNAALGRSAGEAGGQEASRQRNASGLQSLLELLLMHA